MTPEDKLLLTCTRQNFQAAHRCQVLDLADQHPLCWEAVLATALKHGVAPLVFANLKQCSPLMRAIPNAILKQFELHFLQNIACKEGEARKLQQALAFFRRQAIEVMVIKGAALDILVYDHPYLTVSRDIDLVLNVRFETLSEPLRRDIGDQLYGWGIEYDYFVHHDVVMNGVLPVDFERIWADALAIDFRGQAAWVMTPEDMLLSACINSCRKRFFKLKSLADINEIIEKFGDRLNWDNFVSRTKAYQCQNIVYTALAVTALTLDSQFPPQVLACLNLNPMRVKLIQRLIRYLGRRTKLATTYPFSGRTRFGREVNSSLLLPYATYSWPQLWRKLAEIRRVWQAE